MDFVLLKVIQNLQQLVVIVRRMNAYTLALLDYSVLSLLVVLPNVNTTKNGRNKITQPAAN